MQNQRTTRSTYAANVGINKAAERSGGGCQLPADQQVALCLRRCTAAGALEPGAERCVHAVEALCGERVAACMQSYVRNVLTGLLHAQQGQSGAAELAPRIEELFAKVGTALLPAKSSSG